MSRIDAHCHLRARTACDRLQEILKIGIAAALATAKADRR